jgi:hypothetical protein
VQNQRKSPPMSNDDISATQFRAWLNDDVTKKVFSLLKERREEINHELIDSNALMSNDWHKIAIRLVGERDGLDRLLEIEYGEVEEISEDDEHSPSGAQSIN